MLSKVELGCGAMVFPLRKIWRRRIHRRRGGYPAWAPEARGMVVVW